MENDTKHPIASQYGRPQQIGMWENRALIFSNFSQHCAQLGSACMWKGNLTADVISPASRGKSPRYPLPAILKGYMPSCPRCVITGVLFQHKTPRSFLTAATLPLALV